MTLSKYRRIRNEYALADPQLYKLADKNDPEALLEGVSMAGVIGLLRQLGDLAQFAAEIFHDLHEEVTATAARGHTLIIRIEQLEADFPLVERTLLTQTSHTSFLYNSGVEGHPSLQMDENLVTRGGLPRLVMDSYEECRGPPRLFLLDKFDVAGAGACLKRYTDPSFFKTESISNGRNSEGQREKKSQRVKNRAPCWRNGDTLESFPSSHAKLHQLFLEESLENGGNDNEHRVKLKRRQFIGMFLDHEKKKSYMEKFVYVTPPEQKFAISNAGRGLGPELVEISTVSPIKNDKNLLLSIDTTQLDMKPSVDDCSAKNYNEITDSEAVEVPGLDYRNDTCKIVKLVNDEEYTDKECNLKPSVDDGFASEIDKGHREPESLFSDSQSIGNSTTSEEGSNFVKGRENSSSSISLNSLVETATDLDTAVPSAPAPASAPESNPYDMSLDCHFMSKGIPGNDTEEYPMASNLAVEVDVFPRNTPDIQETPTDQNTIHRPRDMEANVCQNSLPSHEVDEQNSNFVDLEVVDSPSAPQKADSWHWSSGKHPLHDEACQNSVVCFEQLDNVSSTSEDSVYFPLIESRKADTGPPILFASEVGAHPSSQRDHSVREIFTYLESGINASSFSLPDPTETMPPISSVTQACAPQSSLSEFSEATVYFGDEPNSNVISGSPVGNATYLDDYGTQTIQIESNATTEHESDKHHDQSKDFSLDAFPSDMPSELIITSNFVTATESNSSLNHNGANMEHKEIVINCCEQVHAENDLQENVIPVLNMLPGEPRMSIEPPCLPPMPPLQWRLGRFQNSMNKTDIAPRLPRTPGHREYSSPIVSEQGVLMLPAPLDVSSQDKKVGFRREDVDPSSATAQTSTGYQNGNQTLIEACQPSVYALDSGSLVEASASEDCVVVVEENLNSKIGKPKLITEVREQEGVTSQDELPQPALVASETASTFPSTQNGDSANVDANVNDTLQKKPVRPRNPLIDEVVAIDKSKLRKVERVNQAVESKAEEGESLLEQLQLRKVGERAAYKPMEEIGSQLQLRKIRERVELQFEETESPRVQLRKVVGSTHSLVVSKTENIDSLLEQIKNKSFNLKPAVMARPNIQGPRTNLKLAAILQKASNIRQAMAGSDEDDQADNWSESDC